MEFDENQSVPWKKTYTEYKSAQLRGLQRMLKLERKSYNISQTKSLFLIYCWLYIGNDEIEKTGLGLIKISSILF
jgi:hypothetical protein